MRTDHHADRNQQQRQHREQQPPTARRASEGSGAPGPARFSRRRARLHAGTGARTILLGGLALAGGLALLEATQRRAVPRGEPYATVRRSVVIAGDVASDACAVLSDPARLNGLLEGVSVKERAPGRWQWTFAGPGGVAIPVLTTIVDDQPGRRLAWRADARSIMPHEDVYVFLPSPDGGGTVVEGTVSLYPSPALPLSWTGRMLRTQADRQLATLLGRLSAALDPPAVPRTTGRSSVR